MYRTFAERVKTQCCHKSRAVLGFQSRRDELRQTAAKVSHGMTISVLVTGAGSAAGHSLISCFQNTAYRIVATSTDGVDVNDSSGAVKCYTAPPPDHRGYVPALLDICEKEGCALLYPGTAGELAALAAAANSFGEIGTTAVVSSPEVLALAEDQLATHDFLLRNELPAAATLLWTKELNGHLGFPLMIRPRRQTVPAPAAFRVADKRELAVRMANSETSQYVAQQFLEGEEYECGTINFEGKCFGVLVMKRSLHDGDANSAVIVREPLVEQCVKKAAESLKPFGSCTFRLRVCHGVPYIIEIQARTTIHAEQRAAAGFNEALMTADYLIHARQPAFEIREGTILPFGEAMVSPNALADTRAPAAVAG